MSQVRKLLQGNGGIPKTYNLILDGQTFTIDDDQLTQINNEIASLDPRYRAYLGGVSGAIASGVFVGDRAQNKISTPALSNLNDKEMEFLKAGKQNLWEAITDSNTYRAKEAINEALNIVSRVINSKKQKESTSEQTPDKKIAYNREAKFDYNLDKDGNYIYSSNPINGFIESRFPSYLDWLSNDKWGDTNKWETPLGDNEAILRGWYAGLGSREAAEATINNALNEVKTKPWDKVSEETKELLKYFNITNATMGGDSGFSSGSGGIYNEDGTVNPNARTNTGGFFIYKGSQASGQDPNGWYTNYNVNSTSVPYLITESDWAQLGIDATSPYAHGIIYNNRLYTEDEVNKYPGSELYAIMKRVADINANTMIIGKEKYDALRSLINWYGSSNDYAYYDYDPDSVFVKNKMLRERLGNKKYSLFDASRFYNYNHPSELIGYYDYSAPSDLPWGFRSPKFIEGNLDNDTYTPKTDIEGMTYNPYVTPNVFEGDKYFAPWVEIKDKRLGTKRYGIYKTIYNTVTREKTDVYFDYDEDENIRLWVKKGNNKLIPVSERFKEELGRRDKFTGKEITEGKVYVNGEYLKDGGKVDYIAKLQAGFVVPPSKPVSTEAVSPGNNVEEGHIFDENGDFDWNSLPGADKKELTAMALDLSGAIAGWFGPWGSVGGAVAGLAGTGFNTAADIERGRGFWGTAGSTVLNAGLDVVSAIPELGEIAQIAKLGKTVERISKNAKLINWIGKAFNVYGLGAAWEPFKKVLNGGFKDLTTDEAYALANGLRVIMSGTRTKLQHRGDSRLAAEITNTKNELGLNNPVHNGTATLAKDVDIKFTQSELNSIHEGGENSGKILRNKLLKEGADPNKLEVDDEKLLTRFGFTVTKDASGKIAKVDSPEGYSLDTHTRTVDLKGAGTTDSVKLDDDDIRTILAGNQDAPKRLRDILKNKYHVDPSKINTDDGKLLKEFNFGYTKTAFGKDRGKISHVYKEYGLSTRAKSKFSPNEQFTKYGYLTDLLNGSSKRTAFIDESLGNDQIRTQIDALMRTTGKNTPDRAVQRAYARSQYRRGEAPIQSGNSRFMPNLNEEPSVQNNTAQKTTSTNSKAERIKQMQEAYIKARAARNAGKPYVTVENPEVKTSTSASTSAVQSEMKKAYSTPAVKDRTSDIISKRKAIAKKKNAKRVAENIEKLRNSKDPMLTLKEMSEEDAKLLYDDAQYELVDAIEASIKDMWDRGAFRSQNEASYYRNNLYNLFKGFYKNGGIIKAQKGYTIRWKWTDADGTQRIDETQYEGAVPPRDILESLLAEERDKRTVWKKTGLEKDSRVLQYPEYEIIYPSSDNTQSVRFESGSGNSQHLLPEIPETLSSYGLNTNYEVSPYQTFAYSNLNPQNNIGDVVKSVSKPTEQKIVKVKTNKQKDFSDLVNVLENLLDKRKDGGIIKAQSGLKFSVPSEIEVPSNLSTDLINKIAYRPNTDWGTYVNGKYTPFGLLGPYQLKYETNAQRYDDARNAFIDTYGFSYNPQSKSYLSEYGAKDVIEQPVEESLPGNETPLPELNDGWNTPIANDAVQDIAAAIGQKIPAKASSSSTVKKNNIALGGGYNDNISDKTKWINPLISTFRYGLNAWAQRKYTDQAIKAINAGRFNELPVWQNLPVMTNPTLDRQLQQVHLERMAGMKPVTSDLIANNALWNQREGQLYDRENDIYGKQSAFQWDAAREGLNIMNQNLANQIKVANDNRARSASLNSAIEQQKMAFIQMLNQSRQNALLEVQNNVMNDRKTMLAYEQNQYNQQLQRDYDSYLRRVYSDAAYDYSKLDYAERSKYNDLEDYILRNVPGSAEDISTKRSEILNNQLRWNRDNALNYNYDFLAGKTSKAGNRTLKKGGRVNGTTRYTLDPDERIWVDNNKAAHAGVAKLTDNVIKLILRALK